ncbi:alpha/beta fold hydrolase [Lentzea tibetensis]|uniref:Alpha/beta fold hydrolase n=1 Tax=Lentzea tibetensis TaxID=2591470 RepID=A0A563F0N3_9PSEU|nr:alpha/beta hydrolase [Lentzea tibetensis]TWP53338.1 alpha/beta fold hydrolase [Lentzea tibetensis]
MELAFDDEGAGPALVLVHGHPFNRSMWRPQVEHFRSSHRVIAPDLRGYGASPVVPGKTPLAAFAWDIADLLDRLKVENCIMAGLSMGGQIVMEFHRLFPERLRGMVLADTSPVGETPEGKEFRYATAERLLAEGMEPYADEVLPLMVSPANAEASKIVLEMMRASPPEGAAAALRGRAERPDYVESLAHTETKTLIVVGREDAYTPVNEAEELHSRMRDSELVIVEGAAHLPNLERPEEFNAALERFLGRA